MAKDAYSKMLEDGSAFKEVDMSMHTEPNLAEAQGVGRGLGDKKKSNEHTDYTKFDNHMEERMQSLRDKMNGKSTVKTNVDESKEILLLKKRIKKIEEALILIMKTHEELLG